MAIFHTNNTRIAGLAACVPKNEISNQDYDWISEKERDLLIKTIGVDKRRVAPEGMTTSDLAFEAAEKLLADLQWDKKEIDMLIFVSQSGDYIIPATAPILQDRLKLPKTCLSFDIGLGCSGYVYGLSIASNMMAAGFIKKALLLVGDLSNVTSSYKDKSTYPLFGDAATATALQHDINAPSMPFNLQTDGAGHKAIMIRDGGVRHLVNENSLKSEKITEGIERAPMNIILDGVEVFNFSLREVVPNIKKLLKETGGSLDDFDYLLFHQANKLINNTIRKMLKADPAKVPFSIQDFGNTSSASIPLTLVSQLRDELQNRKMKLLLSAFGIGLSWGTTIIETDHIVCPQLLEL